MHTGDGERGRTLSYVVGLSCPSIESTFEAIAIMATGAVASSKQLLLRTFEFQSWFHILTVADSEKLKCVIYANGGLHDDLKMEMVKTVAVHNLFLITSLIAAILNTSSETEELGDTPQKPPAFAVRRHALSMHHGLVVPVVNYQEYIPSRRSAAPRLPRSKPRYSEFQWMNWGWL